MAKEHGKVNLGLVVSLLMGISVILGILYVRAGQSRAATAEEFVEKYSAAFRRKDAGAVMKMNADPHLHQVAGIPDELRKEVLRYRPERAREELERQFEAEDMFYKAWFSTRYFEERPHRDHIHVTVDVSGAKAEIVLVREGEYLKMHPFPSVYAYEDLPAEEAQQAPVAAPPPAAAEEESQPAQESTESVSETQE